MTAPNRTTTTATAHAFELDVVGTSAVRGLLKACQPIIHRDCHARQAALGLAQRFVHGGKEADGSPTRDRLKLMPRVVNKEEWARTAPLSGPVSLPTMHCSCSVSTPSCIAQRATNEADIRVCLNSCELQQLQVPHRVQNFECWQARSGGAGGLAAADSWKVRCQAGGRRKWGCCDVTTTNRC